MLSEPVRTKPKLGPELQANLQAEQFRILRTQVPILYAVLSINIAILCFSIFEWVSLTLSMAVPGAFGALIAIRLGVWLTRQKSRPTKARIDRFLKNTTVIAALVSLGLGIWGVALLQSSVSDKPFVPLFIAFGAIACAYCLASLPRAAFATIFLSTTPVILALLTSGIRLQQTTGINLLLIFVLILRLIVHQYKYLVDMVISHAKVKALAYADPLTGLPNRRSFIEGLKTSTGKLVPPARMAVAMIDLDGFKAINDTYGHATGDGVLIQAAERLRSACAGNMIVARLGGDEFAVLIEEANDIELVKVVGEAIVRAMAKPFVVDGLHIRLAASIGLSGQADGGAMPTDLMAQADMALYEVKHSAGNGVLLFAPDMAVRLRRHIAIEQALRETDPRPQIEVVYQPIFDARSMKLATFEALARWNHPVLGEINPLEFIGVAEQTGTIAALSQQIFAAAIEEASHWPSPIGLSLNLSAVELSQPSTPLAIMALCHLHSFNPRRLEVEVTETSVLADFEVARQQLELLRGIGIQVALDDFGSGYASITYLKEITFDRVKIDGELITDIIGSPKARRLVQGILQLCSAVGLPATAEKVECERQLGILVGLGCTRLQGYLLGRPLNAVAARELATGLKRAA